MDAERDKIMARMGAREALLLLARECREAEHVIGAQGIERDMARIVGLVGDGVVAEVALDLKAVTCAECGVTLWEDEAEVADKWSDERRLVCGPECAAAWRCRQDVEVVR
jgi:hypothetical protein